jgi:hypothetical protein
MTFDERSVLWPLTYGRCLTAGLWPIAMLIALSPQNSPVDSRSRPDVLTLRKLAIVQLPVGTLLAQR